MVAAFNRQRQWPNQIQLPSEIIVCTGAPTASWQFTITTSGDPQIRYNPRPYVNVFIRVVSFSPAKENSSLLVIQ